jgi:hypothetical protein
MVRDHQGPQKDLIFYLGLFFELMREVYTELHEAIAK